MLTRVVFSLLIGLIGTAVLVWLGLWQLQRLEWKQAILSDISARIQAEPVDLPLAADPEEDRYLPVQIEGTMTGDEIHVLVSQKHIGAGYRIITAFITQDDRRILVDRGFVKSAEKLSERPLGAVRIVGNLHWPDEKPSSIPDPDVDSNIWFARDVPAMAQHLNTEELLVITRESSFPNNPVSALPVDTAGIPNDHLQYAITWFSLAAIWLLMTLTFLWRGRSTQKS